MSERILLALDAGGSRTRCVVAGAGGRVLGTGTGGAANHVLDGFEVARASLRAAIDAALAAAAPARIDAAVAASAGVGPDGQGREVVESLVAGLLPPGTAVQAVGDMVAALWGALADGVGIVSCAGTGSVCLGRDAGGRLRQVGGWGHLMGDEGSAHDIALAALRAVARAYDGRGPETALSAALPRWAGVSTPIELAWQVYAGAQTRERIAAIAVEVAAAARAGDAVATALLGAAAAELVAAVAAAARHLEMPAPRVSYAGSVFDAGAPVLGPFAALLARELPGARLEAPLLPPLGGALRLAHEVGGGGAAPAAALARWRAALGEAA